MTASRCVWMLVLVAIGARAEAQTSISGAAEVTVAQTKNTTDDHASENGSVWQNYSIGLHSSLLDPRFVKYDVETTFRVNSLSLAAKDLSDQHGKQNDLGFRAGAFVLPEGAFPFYVQASRVFAGSEGELASANPLRGAGVTLGATSPSFETEQRNLTMGGQMNVPGLPRAEVSYRRAAALVTGGSGKSAQRDHDLSGSVVRETSRSRHALRYQRTGYAYTLAETFSQQIDNLDYDFSARLWSHLQLTARAGQRRNLADATIPVAPIDPSDDPYAPPPTNGRSVVGYATAGLSFDPNSRLAMRLNGTWDQQRTEVAATQAGLGTATVHAEIVRGLVLDASAVSGQREQVIDGHVVMVTTSSGVGGFGYSGGPRWLSLTVSANTGQGINETPDGERASTRSWAREAGLSSTIGWFGIGAGYERVMNTDAILDYGNYNSERYRASVNLQSARVSFNASGDQLWIVRGLGATLSTNRQDTFSGSLSARLWREISVTAIAGGFTTTYASATGVGVDRSVFAGVSAQAAFHRSLHATAWVRNEDTVAAATGFIQRGLSAFGRLEYRLRTLHFGLEYRHNDSVLHYGHAPLPSLYRGHQLRLSVTRQFGFRF